MLRKSFSLILLALFLMAPTLATAEEFFPGKWWRMPDVSDELQLSEDQKEQFDELFLQNRSRLSEYKGDLEKEQASLKQITEREPLDEAAVMLQLNRLEAARTRLATERFRYLLEIRKRLGQEKFDRLKKIYRSRDRMQEPTPAKRLDSKRESIGLFGSNHLGAGTKIN